MQRLMCKGKIHRATVTEADLNYVGSITIDALLMRKANILPYEMVQVTNLRNATRWKTYAIPATEGCGKIGLNGPPAHLFHPGDLVIILSMGLMNEAEIASLKPQVVFVDEENQVLRVEEHDVIIQEQEVKPYE
ncbi:aspartate 1-decarboxylase [Paenibacillus chondroitinus]|uniref:Aspartate 1-decarboxylase n=1 Tax=Paenibacillus chondroitinus TaxID=59842 RepID=A0ABU6DA61_9BACL|nr:MULTISPECIES: aspartate 1-decarboxylase [Paenibacillus]MCY9656943.1 aspartate 1-decarboxylase [Paenibacillus anseongense]MEB4794593.1 aspartate 1-decarboxylase [Paenibacillus chondroitinus]